MYVYIFKLNKKQLKAILSQGDLENQQYQGQCQSNHIELIQLIAGNLQAKFQVCIPFHC